MEMTSHSEIIINIYNIMIGRTVVNHAVNESWGEKLNELNCLLHPFDTISTSSRSTLNSLETCKLHLFGKDCFAGNIVLRVNKFRYKDGESDPKGFVTFLDENDTFFWVIIPWYWGNHILFHISGNLIEHHDKFLQFFTYETVSCDGLQARIRQEFENPSVILEM